MGLLARDGRALPLQLEDEPPRAAPLTERVLVLDEAKNFFTFVDVDAEPVPSLLRGFSAPVVLADGLDDADLLVLLQHDSDPFNRWEAGQRWRSTACSPRCAAAPRRCSTRRSTQAMRERAARPAARRRVQGTAALAAERGLHRRAARRSSTRRASTRRARRCSCSSRRPCATTGPGPSRRTRSQAAIRPTPVSAGRRALANLALTMLCLDAQQRGDARVARARLAALQGRPQHDRSPGRV